MVSGLTITIYSLPPPSFSEHYFTFRWEHYFMGIFLVCWSLLNILLVELFNFLFWLTCVFLNVYGFKFSVHIHGIHCESFILFWLSQLSILSKIGFTPNKHILWLCLEFLLQIMRDPETGNSRGFGFISYDSFEASDSAIEVYHCWYSYIFVNLVWQSF